MANRFNQRRGFDSGRGGRGSPGIDRGRGSSSPSGFRGSRGGDRGDRVFGRGGHGQGFSSRDQGGIFLENQPAHIDTRLADDSDKALITRFQDSQLGNDSESMPLRPDFGTIGEHIKLRTNFFPVHISEGPLYEYEVAITPAAGAASRAVKRRIFQLAEQTTAWRRAGMNGTVAHDSSAKLISAHILNQPLPIKVFYYEDDQNGPPAQGGKEYTLAVTFVREINSQDLMSYLNGDIQYRNYNTLPIISALNLILAAHPLQNGIKVGQDRYFFPSAAAPADLGGGLEAWRGFYSSVRPAHRQLMVNVNVCTTAFYTPGKNLAKQIMPFSNSHPRMETFCRNVRVKTTHLGSRKTVRGLASQNARQYLFQCDEFGGRVSVEQYFFKKYQIRLEYPDLPLVDVGGYKNTKSYLPAEVCEILPGQPFLGELTDEHTATMIKIACQPPNVNGNAIMNNGLKVLGFVNPGSTLTAFGVSIDPNMAVVPGRILPKPRLKYAGNASPSVDERASWNLQKIRFAVGAHLQKWAVLLIGDGAREEFGGTQDPALRTVIDGFIAMCKKSGMDVEQPAIAAANIPLAAKGDPFRKSAISTIRETLQKLKHVPSLVLVILSNGDTAIYEGLKQLCDVELGIATVCVQVGKIRKEKGQPQYFANVALKVNMKMGGINHKLEPDGNTHQWLTSVPTMVVGMDVTHPGRGSAEGTPSIAAVVASVDAEFSQYPASLGIQKSRKEMITNLKDMMVARLRLYQKHNGKTLPQRVLVYRDGVSEGQFNIVRVEELPEILKAFHVFDEPKKPYRPKLTIVICGKRHHTRFYPTEKKDAAHDGNPKPGTVVDRGVTALYDFDFFLQAHGVLKGTARPTHYYVVHNEIGFNADDLQWLTNALSYMFARATKGVSLVSPAYYADIACERGRCYLRKLLKGGGRRAREEDVKREAEALWGSGVSDKLKDTMFYL